MEHQGFLVVGKAVVQKRGGHACLHQGPHLVFHQADQRRYHKGDARQQQGRHLVTDGLARARGHHGQHILPAQQPLHDLLLAGAETVVAENFFKIERWSSIKLSPLFQHWLQYTTKPP